MAVELTQYEKILALMIRAYPAQTWFYAKDFMQPYLGNLFVGYEAGSRLSELSKKYPEVFDTEPDGKYKKYRFKMEEKEKAIQILPADLSTFVVKELNNTGMLNVEVI